MAYYIFLKSLRVIEEFRKNPHNKISPKSPCTNFQSLCKFKNPILFLKGIFPGFRPNQLSSQPSHMAFWPNRPSWSPSSQRRNRAGAAAGRPRAAPWPPPATSVEGKNCRISSSSLPPLNGAPSPLQSSINRWH
jgi:hypothetical protein